MADQPRDLPPVRVAILLLLLTGSLHLFSVRIIDLFFFFVPFSAAILVLVSAWTGPFWSVVAVVLLGSVVIHPTLSVGRWDLLVLWWAIVLTSGVLTTWGRGRLKTWEKSSQAGYEAALEEVNALQERLAYLAVTDKVLRKRLQRYATLRTVMDVLSAQSTHLEVLLSGVARQALSVLDHADVGMVYLVEMPRYELALHSVFWRAQTSGTVKRKTGDLYDQWVLRQGQPLLVRDVTKDFRFPREAAETDRLTGSVMVVPLISAQRVLGILRAESTTPSAFSPEDLRLLDIVADVSAMAIENVRLYQRTSELAVTDDLTGLAVHRYFHERLEEELARARMRNQPVSILLIDLDRFKSYNDTYGHPAGDKLLRVIAQLLRQTMTSGEFLARYGGEEFAVMLTGTDLSHAARQAELIRRAVEAQEIVLRQGRTRVTISIGVAVFPADGLHREQLLEVADKRLYRAKAEGRNRVCAS